MTEFDDSVRRGRRRGRASTAAEPSQQVRLVWQGKPTIEEPARGAASGERAGGPTLDVLETVGAPEDEVPNLLFHADAADALELLAADPRYGRKVALCYIDPPFNRGEDFAHYGDAIARHAWMSMLHERLAGIREVLAPDGSVWLHLDDAAQHHGRCLLDEVFGAGAFVATVIWQRRTSRDNRKAFSGMHDYIHVYSPSGPLAWKRRRNALPDDGAFANPDGDPRGPWRSVPLTAQAGHATAAQFYTVVSPTGERHEPPAGRCWTYSRERLSELEADGRVYWPRGGSGKPRLKRFQSEVEGLAPFTIWGADEVGENAHAKKDLLALFDDRAAFDTPKPERLLQRIVHVGSRPGEIVLDCFLGSGTTAATAHKMGRRWVGVERSDEVFQRFSLPRLRRVVAGDDGVGISPVVGWSGGGGFVVAAVQRRDEDAEQTA